MKTSHHPNPITRQIINARFQAPPGSIQRGARTWRMGKVRGSSSRTKTYEGVHLVRWLIDQGRREEAKAVFTEIQAGKRPAQ